MSSELQEEAEIRSGRYQVLTLLCASAAIAYIQRAALSVPAEEVAKDLQFSDLARDMGSIQSVWYFAYALMQIPAGWLADRLGARKALTIFCIVWSLATLLAAFANGYWTLVLTWGLMGAAQAGAFPCAAKSLGTYLPGFPACPGNGNASRWNDHRRSDRSDFSSIFSRSLDPIGKSHRHRTLATVISLLRYPRIAVVCAVLVLDLRTQITCLPWRSNSPTCRRLDSNA